MKKIQLAVGLLAFVPFTMNAQINLGEKALGALQKGVASFTFSDEDAAQLSKASVEKMDKENPIAGPKDPYTLRLNKLFGKHKTESGVTLNFKVYKVKEVNAFACADGSVRVFQGLLDVMDDNEVLAVIGHEIGHVVNHDTRDAIRAAYQKEALVDAVGSQVKGVAAVSESALGKIGSAIVDSRHSQKQESEADMFSYDFMKKHGYNVNAVESAFTVLAGLSQGADSGFMSRILSSHPDPKDRAAKAKQRAESEGIYKPYTCQLKKTSTPAKKKK
ncbi:M48 family metalloprotease YggG [Flavobacterium columnare]|uniref:M48 family metalloprotease n=1 Tax=Flavobacterium columnare TaxID=996 RepID=UPI0007F9B902|nr:M48 family metalloprotease [Flavobacterium columnare]ANO47359.1 M48 family metalloprotease YggG [Flavobacterium columnare]APT21984.1 peptidase [Flavobacterium columnare]